MPNVKSQNKSNKPVAKKRNSLSKVQVRSLTVSHLTCERKRLTFDTWQNRNKVAYLKLTGKWLEEAGFTISRKVNIIVRNNLLIIETVNE